MATVFYYSSVQEGKYLPVIKREKQVDPVLMYSRITIIVKE